MLLFIFHQKKKKKLGASTFIGDTGDNFAGMDFDSDGILWAVSGGQSPFGPHSLFQIDIISAIPTFVVPLSIGESGESLAFSYRDGVIYRCTAGLIK